MISIFAVLVTVCAMVESTFQDGFSESENITETLGKRNNIRCGTQICDDNIQLCDTRKGSKPRCVPKRACGRNDACAAGHECKRITLPDGRNAPICFLKSVCKGSNIVDYIGVGPPGSESSTNKVKSALCQIRSHLPTTVQELNNKKYPLASRWIFGSTSEIPAAATCFKSMQTRSLQIDPFGGDYVCPEKTDAGCVVGEFPTIYITTFTMTTNFARDNALNSRSLVNTLIHEASHVICGTDDNDLYFDTRTCQEWTKSTLPKSTIADAYRLYFISSFKGITEKKCRSLASCSCPPYQVSPKVEL